MYVETFGTDWDTLERHEAVERAFALGVAVALDAAPDGERDRLRDAVTGGYDVSLIDLAFQEGKATAEGLREPGSDARSVWDAVVGTADDPGRESAPGSLRSPQATDLPRALRRLPILERSQDHLDRVRLPEFLR